MATHFEQMDHFTLIMGQRLANVAKVITSFKKKISDQCCFYTAPTGAAEKQHLAKYKNFWVTHSWLTSNDVQPMLYKCWSSDAESGQTLKRSWVDVSLLSGLNWPGQSESECVCQCWLANRPISSRISRMSTFVRQCLRIAFRWRTMTHAHSRCFTIAFHATWPLFYWAH